MKTAFVTGASAGIGQAIARRLLADGYRVYAGARRVERMSGLAEAGVVVLPLDVTDDTSMVAAIETIHAQAGRVDILVNNAGYGSYGALEELPLDEARRQFEVNVFGLARLTQLVLPAMREARSGTIVNISSIGGKIYEPFGTWYHATKFAVEGLSDSLRMELRPFGVRVIVIQPGAIKTEWASIARENLLQHSGSGPYKRYAEAHALMFARSDVSSVVAPPEAVARIVSRAVAARWPRARYPAAGGAMPLLMLRRIVPDRLFDHALRLIFWLAR